MREIRQSGSEGGGGESNCLSLPLFLAGCPAWSERTCRYSLVAKATVTVVPSSPTMALM